MRCVWVLVLACITARGADGPWEARQQAALGDLAAIERLLAENDSGYPDHVARHGEAHFAQARERAAAAIRKAHDERGAYAAMYDYLRMFRKGHLWLEPVVAAPADASGEARQAHGDRPGASPEFRLLDRRTAYLRLPSMDMSLAEPLRRLLARHHRAILERPVLVIDLRGNTGGFDSVYAPLLPYVQRRRIVAGEMEVLVSPQNIEGWRAIREKVKGDAEAERWVDYAVAKMSASHTGFMSFGLMAREPEPKTMRRWPRRVAVMIDGGCVSSCEAFVLEAVAGGDTTTFGRATFGALDYSNIRLATLPSGRYRLAYATTRMRRPDGFSVDAAGIAPQVVLPLPDSEPAYRAEVDIVRRAMASATSRPRPQAAAR